jgi:hypothetical protein
VANQEGWDGRSAACGVVAVVFGAGAFATWPVAVTPKSTFPIWPTYVCAGIAVIALYMCFAMVFGLWPTGRAVRTLPTDEVPPPGATHDPDTRNASSGVSGSALPGRAATGPPASLPSPPVAIRLRPELDAATNRLRLGALNRGDFGRFRVKVIDAHNQDGNWVGPSSWPVPWLDDGSVSSKEIPFGKPLLDFAHFDFLALQEELAGAKEVQGDHWIFPSQPQPVTFRYSAVSAWSDLSSQYIVITLRVIRDEPEGHVDLQFKLGTDETRPYCRELPEKPAAAMDSAGLSSAAQSPRPRTG